MSKKLSEPDVQDLVKLEEQYATFSVQAIDIADTCPLTRTGVAERMGVSLGVLRDRLKGMAYRATVDEIGRFAWACGYKLEISFVKKET